MVLNDENIEYCVGCGISIFANDIRYRRIVVYNELDYIYMYRCNECGRFTEENKVEIKR